MNETPHLMQDHLNDEQFSALLAGEPLPGAQAHLHACAECRAEMDRVATAMESFEALAMEWAEVRSATMPPVRRRQHAAWARPLAWGGVTAVLALGIAVGVRHQSGFEAAPVTTASGATAVAAPAETASATASAEPARQLTREEQIAEDNRMLLAIRQELTSQDALTLGSSSKAASTSND